jgi:hypothetical protein
LRHCVPLERDEDKKFMKKGKRWREQCGHAMNCIPTVDILHHLSLSWVWWIHFTLCHPFSLKSSWKLFSRLCLGLHICPFPSAFSFLHQTCVCIHFSAMHATCQLIFVITLVISTM